MDQMVANRLNRWIDLGLGLVLMIFDVLFSSLSLLLLGYMLVVSQWSVVNGVSKNDYFFLSGSSLVV